jgi:hypothetical protein
MGEDGWVSPSSDPRISLPLGWIPAFAGMTVITMNKPSSIMISALRYFQHLLWSFAAHPIDEAMFAVYTPRPPAFQLAAQRLWLAGTPERRPATFLYQRIYSFGKLWIMFLEISIFRPTFSRE